MIAEEQNGGVIKFKGLDERQREQERRGEREREKEQRERERENARQRRQAFVFFPFLCIPAQKRIFDGNLTDPVGFFNYLSAQSRARRASV